MIFDGDYVYCIDIRGIMGLTEGKIYIAYNSHFYDPDNFIKVINDSKTEVGIKRDRFVSIDSQNLGKELYELQSIGLWSKIKK